MRPGALGYNMNMRITVGTTNKVKLQAVHEAVALYPRIFPKPKIISIDVPVALYGHPKTLEETIGGALERAKKAFDTCSYSIGLEGGLMEAPYTRHGFLETGACAIYDGERYYLGLGPAFEWPGQITEFILQNKGDASQAFKQLGFTKEDKLGMEKGGILGLLTDNRITREALTKTSIIMALIQLEKSHFYR